MFVASVTIVGDKSFEEVRGKMATKKKQKYYEVIGIPGDGHQYKLGFTSNKSKFQKASGWPMKKLKFITKYK